MFWNRKPQQKDILNALRDIYDPLSGQDIVEAQWVDGIVLQDGEVLVTLRVDPQQARELDHVRRDAQSVLASIKGITGARVILTAEKQQQAEMPQSKIPDAASRRILPDVKRVIAVASGKGGVGKSTVAVNLAISLQQQGLRVGILDADIYGPSVPMLLGVRDTKPEFADDYILPIMAHGLAVMSMGFMVDEDKAMIWRGPMIQKALMQMLRDVAWGTLDVLVIDMPPGTGDAQLTIAQKVPLAGALIVSTPQDVALLDAARGVAMFQKIDVPIIGLVENMSFFCCPSCGHEAPIFGRHGARDRAAQLGVPFLGAVPIDMDIRSGSDSGNPVSLAQEHAMALHFTEIAAMVTDRLNAAATI